MTQQLLDQLAVTELDHGQVRTWDPTAAPYVTRECRARRHHNCARGLIWYPAGVNGDPVDVPCVCDADECPCAKNAKKVGG